MSYPIRIQLLLLMLLWVGFSEALAGKRIAVLEVQGEANPSHLSLISDEVRSGVLEASRSEAHVVMGRENMAVLIRDMGLDPSCVEGECEVETGRNIGAAFVVSGKVISIGDVWVCMLKLHDTQSGSLLATQSVRAPTLLGVVDGAPNAAKELMRVGLNQTTGSPAVSSATVETVKSSPPDDVWGSTSESVAGELSPKPPSGLYTESRVSKYGWVLAGVGFEPGTGGAIDVTGTATGAVFVARQVALELGVQLGFPAVAPIAELTFLTKPIPQQTYGAQLALFLAPKVRLRPEEAVDVGAAAGVRIGIDRGVMAKPSVSALFLGDYETVVGRLECRVGLAF